jgi:hypothetical protein
MTYKRTVPVSDAGSPRHLPRDPFAQENGAANPMALWDIPAINADPLQCGLAGSPTKVKHIDSVVLTAADIRYIDPGEVGVSELIHGLIADHTFG